MRLATDAPMLQDILREFDNAGHTWAFVPTMGALHQGHLSLVDHARKYCDKVVVSVFVNPTQFGPNEDFAKYPRTFEQDQQLLASRNTDLVFYPTAQDIYPDGFQTYVNNQELGGILCGKSRQNHFQGVLTVVLKLFNLVRPDTAVFGQKDYQQFCLLSKMVKDLNVPVKMIGADTFREPDGLAMSSRNIYLNSDERKSAPFIFKALQKVRERFLQGEAQSANLIKIFAEILAQSPCQIITEYVEIRNEGTLQPYEGSSKEKPVVLFAGQLGSTRLIDNLRLSS